MKLEELQHLECNICDVISYYLDKFPGAGTSEWGVAKVELINAVLAELGQMEIEI